MNHTCIRRLISGPPPLAALLATGMAALAQGLAGQVAAPAQQIQPQAGNQAVVGLARAGSGAGGMTRAARALAYAFAGTGAPRTLVLPGDDAESGAPDEMAEDLSIMSRILQKAANQNDSARRVWIDGFRFKEFDALYLDGFGALFLLSVDFPLVKPADGEPAADSRRKDQTWESARRELRGEGQNVFGYASPFQGEPAREYEAPRVTELQENLMNAFQHAQNIRGLKEDDWVCVAVLGPATVRFGVSGGTSGVVGAGAETFGLLAVPFQQAKESAVSVLALRAKKSDIDAFANGTLSRDAFAERVRVTLR